MKTMKLALLGGAALAVMTAGAQADELSDLKAQMEALNARVAAMEAAPAVPAGYSLMTISEGPSTVVPGNSDMKELSLGYGPNATVIGILPTADAPASTTVEWSGYVYAMLHYYNYDGEVWSSEDTDPDPDVYEPEGFVDDDPDADVDVFTRGQLKVVGKTDTAVGEVGARVQLRAEAWSSSVSLDVKPFFRANEYWGWWAMTPELTLGGGYSGSLGNIGYGYDGACNCWGTDYADVAFNPGDSNQMRLSYASGPFSMGIALEDASNFSVLDSPNPNRASAKFAGTGPAVLGVAGEIKYAGDSFSGEIAGVWHDGGDASDSYQGGVGLGFGLGDMFSLSLAAAVGQINNGQDYWGASGLASFNMTDAVHAEVAVGYKNYNDDYDDINGVSQRADALGVLGGIYYNPVPQLTIGLEGEWVDNDGNFSTPFTVEGESVDPAGDSTEIIADLVTIFSF